MNPTNNNNSFFVIRKRLGNNTTNRISNSNRRENESACERRFKKGLATVDYDDTIEELVSLRSWHNCRLLLGNQLFYVNTQTMNKTGFLETIPLLETPPQEDGVYLYILWSNEEAQQVFTCCKVQSILEVGTLHKIIALRKGAQKIHAAGELRVQDGRIHFNLMSGSYMRETFQQNGLQKRKRANTSSCDNEDLKTYMIMTLKKILGESAQFIQGRDITLDSYITKESLPVSLEELQTLERFGATVELFDSKDECFAKKNKIEREQFMGGKKTRKRNSRIIKKTRHLLI